MSFAGFREQIKVFLERSGDDIAVVVHNDIEKKRYIAVFADGTKITGRPSSPVLTVLFGSGHQAMVRV